MGNHVTITGNLTRDVDIKQFNSGALVGEFSIAYNDRKKDRNGEWQDDVNFFECKTWLTDKQAPIVEAALRKGTRIAITDAKLKQDSWETPEGDKRQKVYILINDPIGGITAAPRHEENQSKYPSASREQTPQKHQQPTTQQSYQQPQTVTVYDYDIPF